MNSMDEFNFTSRMTPAERYDYYRAQAKKTEQKITYGIVIGLIIFISILLA